MARVINSDRGAAGHWPGGQRQDASGAQLAAEAEGQYGFRCYWAGPGGQQLAADAVREGNKPVLLVVDYAETVPGLAGLISQATAGEAGVATRVLLLARSAGEWWQQLITECQAASSDMLAAVTPRTLGPLTGLAGQQAVFQEALTAFAAQLNIECPPVQMPPIGAGAVVLVVHAAALLAVLDYRDRTRGTGDGAVTPVASQGDVISRLLGHEARYWEHTQARYQLNLSPAVRERGVAAGTLAGADDEASAVGLLAAVDDLADPAVRGSTARWLHDLYPAGSSDSAHQEWIGPLRPDLVAEHLITRTLISQPGLARAIFSGLPGQRATRALTILARAALTQPAALSLIDLALRSSPDSLIVPTMTVAVETNPAVADHIAAVLTARQPQHDLLTRITQPCPTLPWPSPTSPRSSTARPPTARALTLSNERASWSA